jgi:HlyD family secretion protein
VASFRTSHYLTLAGVLALTTVGGYFAYERFAPRPVVAARMVTADVARGPIEASVTATGSVASPAQSKLAFKSAGRVTDLLVGLGDQVQEGQALARIDDADLRIALQQAQASESSQRRREAGTGSGRQQGRGRSGGPGAARLGPH